MTRPCSSGDILSIRLLKRSSRRIERQWMKYIRSEFRSGCGKLYSSMYEFSKSMLVWNLRDTGEEGVHSDDTNSTV